MSNRERRSARRVAIRMHVDCHYEGNFLLSQSRDLSPDGIYLCTKKPAPVGAEVKLVFSLGELHELTLRARVAWTPGRGSKKESGMGLQFLNLPANLRPVLLDVVHRVALLPEEENPAGLHGTA